MVRATNIDCMSEAPAFKRPFDRMPKNKHFDLECNETINESIASTYASDEYDAESVFDIPDWEVKKKHRVIKVT